MRELRELTGTEFKAVYTGIYKNAFPAGELKPLWLIRRMARRGVYPTLGWFEDGALLGCASLWLGEDGYILLEYFVVPEEKRNAGLGAALLEALLDRYPPGTVFMIESEAPDAAADGGMAERRINFYLRSGAALMGFDIVLWDVRYKMLALSRAPVDEAAVLAHYGALYRRQFPARAWRRFIRIPAAPAGDAPEKDRQKEQL